MKRKSRHIPKINTIHYGGKWIAAGILTGGILPGLFWLLSGVWLWGLCIAGGVILAAFLVVFSIEMYQDGREIPYYENDLKEKIPFDPDKQYACVRSSICTGEKVAGFKSKEDGHFTEVMVIRTPQELERFQTIYGIREIKTEY